MQSNAFNQNQNEAFKHFIPAKEKADIYSSNHIFRACAYCRVSTDSDMQLSSFELQQEHYQKLADSNKNWDLRHIYADEGISGTSLKNRVQFNEMISACKRGEYDLIITKSVSRFARNLVDCISLVRDLKKQMPPVGVFFETDNLFTLSEDSELKLAILSTVAQGESEKKSESMNWSLRERFKNERLLVPDVYGYCRERDPVGRYDKKAKLEIVEEEAKVVRFIYNAFLAGYTLSGISEILNECGIPTKTGKHEWHEATVRYILMNERYCGNILTWKTFTADIFEHTKRRNNHDRDQYLYENDHEAIVTPEMYEAVQTLLDCRRHKIMTLPSVHVIEDGIFTGYVPVNYHWINDDPNVYFEASNSIDSFNRVARVKKTEFSQFDLEGYQVVRGYFTTARAECPCITVTDNRITFNIECMRKFNDVSYVQLLIHPSQRRIAIRPCEEHDTHSIRWRVNSDKPFLSKSISCPYFSSALFRIMQWNPDYQYRVRGTFAAKGRESIIVFDISNAMPMAIDAETSRTRKRAKKIKLCPDEWVGKFGDEFYNFTLRNGFYYINTSKSWKSDSESKEVPNSSKIKTPTRKEILEGIESLKTKES